MNSHAAAVALGALANESRLAIFRLLVKRGPDGFTPGELLTKIDMAAPTLSFHLKELQRAGLVQSRRTGRFLNYSASLRRVRALTSFLMEKCCSLSATERDDTCEPVAAKRKRG
jgi:DNA-binding transcriptional ArsR family regulator